MTLLKFLFAFCFMVLFSPNSDAGDHQTLAEIWLAPVHKDDADGIKSALKKHQIDRVTIQFVMIGTPGAVVAIGRNTPAEGGRMAIQLARIYNRKKIEFLIPEVLVPENYVAVGTSAYDESALVPVSSEDVLRLADPSLSDEAFHSLYQKLTHGDQPFKKDYQRKFNNIR
ncbi:MAG: hypothetical protein HY200_02465 [Nitrospirae bacterium]|nr:hypothetical protein [Nitrospirota bacterium]MBI3593799.1 hypothetical protein [Nitrospirota bacterium]